MSGAETEALAAVTAAVTGPGTPDSATVVARPERFNVWAIALAGPAISSMIIGVLLLIGLRPWPDAVAETRVQALAGIGMALTAILGVVVFRLASGGLKRVEAKAGPGSVLIETGGD